MRRSEVDFRVGHFDRARVMFAPGQSSLARTSYGLFLGGITRALAWLSLPDEFPFANVILAPSRAEFDRFVAHLTSIPTDPGRVGQPQGHDLYLLSPEAYPADAAPSWLGPDGRCAMDLYARLIAHETVHMVEEHYSPRLAMDHRPSWWSEGLAVLISEQHRLDQDVRDHMRSDLDAGSLPSIGELHGGPAYTWGWAIVDFLDRTVGRKRISAMITGTSTADILDALGINPQDIDREWHAHAVAEATAILS